MRGSVTGLQFVSKAGLEHLDPKRMTELPSSDVREREVAQIRSQLRDAVMQARNQLLRHHGALLDTVLAQIPYMVDFKAPKLTPPIDVFDILEKRLFHPHPDFYDDDTGHVMDQDFHQGHHALQSAEWALEHDCDDEVVTAAFLHDYGKLINRRKHSWFSAEMMRPYVSERVYFMIQVHFDIGHLLMDREPWFSAPCFAPEANRLDLEERLQWIRNHEWFKGAALVCKAEIEARTPKRCPDVIGDLRKVLGRTFKLPRQGLGYDHSSAAELWKVAIEQCWMT
jgi:hypothetical protein